MARRQRFTTIKTFPTLRTMYWVAAWMFVYLRTAHASHAPATPFISTHFHVSVQKGALPVAAEECAVKCSLAATCVSFDVSAEEECTLFEWPPDAEIEDGHTVFLSRDRMEENVPPCLPTGARSSTGNTFYVHFDGSDIVAKYALSQVEDMVTGNAVSELTISETYPALVDRTVDALYRYDYDLFIIIGDSVEVQTWNSDNGVYELVVPYYPRALTDEMGDVPRPDTITAADVNDTTLYLIGGDAVFAYRLGGYVPGLTYLYLQRFVMADSTPGNPFIPAPGSSLPHAPSWVSAMAFSEDRKALVVLSFADIFLFSSPDLHWRYIGKIATPCESQATHTTTPQGA